MAEKKPSDMSAEELREFIRERQRNQRETQREATRRIMELVAELHLTMFQLEEAVKSVRSSMILTLPYGQDGAGQDFP